MNRAKQKRVITQLINSVKKDLLKEAESSAWGVTRCYKMEKQTCYFCGREIKLYRGCLGYEALRCEYCEVDYGENTISLQDSKGWEKIEAHLNERIKREIELSTKG
jgi:hypothetical protein